MRQLIEKIAAEIRKQGTIPFVRFMELALYCPVYGYYEKEGDRIGRRGDFFTNVSVGGLFGELLAERFAGWLEKSPKLGIESPKSKVQSPKSNVGNQPGGRVQIVEAGAHDGLLALDILTWMEQRRPELFKRLEYCIVEPSARRQEWQRKTLAAFAARLHWAGDLQELRSVHEGSGGVRGIVFCNELLDAMPVRRLGWDAARRCWFEWGVALDGDRFVWQRMVTLESVEQVSAIIDPAAELVEVLPDGFTVEICLKAREWWREAAEALVEGKLLAVDYGLTDEELFTPERTLGTLRAYRGHRLSSDVLADPGQQDITAHVNFSVIQRAGESVGLTTEGLLYQAQFLTPVDENVIAEWTPEHRRQFQTLTHPEHLGRAFRVLVQSRPSEAVGSPSAAPSA